MILTSSEEERQAPSLTDEQPGDLVGKAITSFSAFV